MSEHITDIEDCPLGRALRAIREGGSRPSPDWSDVPLSRFYEIRVRKLAQLRTAKPQPTHERPPSLRVEANRQNCGEAQRRTVRERVARIQVHIRAALDEGRTLKEAAEWLNERGIKSARGGRWHGKTVQRDADRLGLVGPTRRLSRRWRVARERTPSLEPQFRAAFAQRQTLRGAAAWLDEHGIKPFKGGRWHPSSVLTIARRFGLRGAQS
jgi:hypothetical protein